MALCAAVRVEIRSSLVGRSEYRRRPPDGYWAVAIIPARQHSATISSSYASMTGELDELVESGRLCKDDRGTDIGYDAAACLPEHR